MKPKTEPPGRGDYVCTRCKVQFVVPSLALECWNRLCMPPEPYDLETDLDDYDSI